MSDLPINDNNEEIKSTEAEKQTAEVTPEEEEFSTVFSDPQEHHKKAGDTHRSKRWLVVVAALLAVAVLVGGTMAVVKLIPEKKPQTSSNSSQKEIKVLDLELDKIDSIVVKNSKGEFKFIPTRTESVSSAPDSGSKPVVKTTWSVDGIEPKYTSTSVIAGIVSNAIDITAISEITGRNPQECGFEKPAYTVNIKTVENKDFIIEFGSKSADDAGYYARIKGQDKIYLVNSADVQKFEFELLGLADNTAFKGVPVTDELKDYTQQGTLVSFDKITVTGKNYPQPMVIEMEKGEMAQYLGYTLTSPEKRGAERIDDIFNLFKNGLAVEGAYTFDITPDSLRKYGLDNPYMTLSINVKNYTNTYKIAKVDEEFCAVIDKNSYMIHKVAIGSLPFLESSAENYYGKLAFLVSINDITEFNITADGKNYVFSISSREDDEDDKFDILYKGEKIVSQYFQDFYKDFIGITYTDFKRDGKTEAPQMEATLKFKDGHTETVQYVKDNATRYTCIINGKVMGRVSSVDVTRAIKDLINVAQNKPV